MKSKPRIRTRIFFLVTAIILSLCTEAPAAGWQWIAPQRVYTLVKEGSGLWLVDVRDKEEFEESHIEGAMNIPAEIMDVKHLPRRKTIVLVDDSLGLRKGRQAAQILEKKGNEKVFLLEGGLPAWREEGNPCTGKSMGRIFRSVMPDDIDWALHNGITLRIFDLREKSARSKGPVARAFGVDGKGFDERMSKVKKMLDDSRKKGITAKLEKPATLILVLPDTVDPVPVLEKSFRGVPGDVRYMQGGFATWVARPPRNIAATQGICPTCPGGGSGGKK